MWLYSVLKRPFRNSWYHLPDSCWNKTFETLRDKANIKVSKRSWHWSTFLLSAGFFFCLKTPLRLHLDWRAFTSLPWIYISEMHGQNVVIFFLSRTERMRCFFLCWPCAGLFVVLGLIEGTSLFVKLFSCSFARRKMSSCTYIIIFVALHSI